MKDVRAEGKGKGKSNCTGPSDPGASDNVILERFLQILSAATPAANQNMDAEAVKRVNKGVLGEVLASLAEHMRGREEVKRARSMIMEAGPEGNTYVAELEKAMRRAKAARVAMQVARREREEESTRLETLRKEKETLEERVRRERELRMLLTVLERREGVRMKRVSEVGRMINQLRQEIENAREGGNSRPARLLEVKSIKLQPPKWRPRYTRETLAKLHAYHIRLKADRLTETQIQATQGAEERLKTVIRSSTRQHLTGEEIRQVLTIARRRALRQQITISGQHVDWEGLQNQAREVRNREHEIERLNEVFIAKMALLEKYSRTVKMFWEQNADTISKTLRDEEKGSKGIIETAARALVRSLRSERAEEISVESHSSKSVQLERDLRRCYEIENFLTRLSTLKRTGGDTEIIEVYKRESKETEKRTEKLLERKVKKGRVGMEIVGSVEVLLEEGRVLSR